MRDLLGIGRKAAPSKPLDWGAAHAAQARLDLANAESDRVKAEQILGEARARVVELEENVASDPMLVEQLVQAKDAARIAEVRRDVADTVVSRQQARLTEAEARTAEIDVDGIWRDLFEKHAAWAESAREAARRASELADTWEKARRALHARDPHPLMRWARAVRALMSTSRDLERLAASTDWRRGLGLDPEKE